MRYLTIRTFNSSGCEIFSDRLTRTEAKDYLSRLVDIALEGDKVVIEGVEEE